MRLQTGLKPYCLSHYLGLQGVNTSRVNPNPAGLEGYLTIAKDIGARSIEVWDELLRTLDQADLRALKVRLDDMEMQPLLSTNIDNIDIDLYLRAASATGSRHIRMMITPILCGDRVAAGEGWDRAVRNCREKLTKFAPMAEAAGVTLLIENHQDFTSQEMVELCESFGPAVRISYDPANAFAVGEAPVEYTRIVAPYVRYVHLKDYRVQFIPDGIRLVRCACGDGAVPFQDVFDILGQHNDGMLAAVGAGALYARDIRVFTTRWWERYEPRSALSLAACLLAAQRNRLADGAEWRTPWELDDDEALVDYELAQLNRSVRHVREIGLM
jgi:sugar phosphate isomerase/epimerase